MWFLFENYTTILDKMQPRGYLIDAKYGSMKLVLHGYNYRHDGKETLVDVLHYKVLVSTEGVICKL